MGKASVIRLRGVRQNNLKNLDLDLPVGRLIVVTGLSGAGKSSLVFDTLHAEGNRRYAETFSPYARQFMELMERPKVDSIENIRPSIAIEQGNTVKTSRSTVGTMTELCDYFKVWFARVAGLFDPETGDPIRVDTPESIWKDALGRFSGQTVVLAFPLHNRGNLDGRTVLSSLSGQGYTRGLMDGRLVRLEELDPALVADAGADLRVVQDRLAVEPGRRSRFLEAARAALHFGEGDLELHAPAGRFLHAYCSGLHRPGSTRRFRPASPNLFSFNSPVGACSRCRGFGRIIEIDDRLVIPDTRKSLAEGAIRAFSGSVYSESQRDLMRACRRHRVRTHLPWGQLSGEEQTFVMEGEPDYGTGQRTWPRAWYGVRRFFKWLEENTYKMHVRVFLSRYRAYVPCPDCRGARLQPEALCWKWRGHTLPDLYTLPVGRLLEVMRGDAVGPPAGEGVEHAREAILTRLQYLDSVGLDYLSLNRSSRSLSGGETQRVNLTACLGTSLVDTLFILDEPSVGLHCRDIDRLVGILRLLTAKGNTVVVVEHDESIIAAADQVIELGPEPGDGGGTVVFSGSVRALARNRQSPTGAFLSGRRRIALPERRRPVDAQTAWLRLRDIRKHNLRNLDVDLPLRRLVVLSGVSGSGKSTLLENAIHQGLLSRSGLATEDPASIGEISCESGFGDILMVDQSPVSRTPRSNPAVFTGAWDPIRQLFASTEAARRAGLTAAFFSFNSGNGRCPHCQGLGRERIEMQFMADVYVPCPVCEGRQFKDEVLDIRWRGFSVSEILGMTVERALQVFSGQRKVAGKLESLQSVGLDYLPLGQPLNTLSGGESQRLKLVRYLGGLDTRKHPSLLLMDEPTTGLHRADVERLLGVLQALVETGHSLVVIEHHPDLIRAADWILELGPGAGEAGGQLVYSGTPDGLREAGTATAPYVEEAVPLLPPARRGLRHRGSRDLTVSGAREHNLKNLSTRIPHGSLSVVTGVSGSGKSTLAFDIIFAEGQRRFMESMSSWARQYVEQLPKPDIDALEGIAPTVAIEQRVTRGTRKSTVATITEVAQYLRLLYARIGVQHSPATGEPLVALPREALGAHVRRRLQRGSGSRRIRILTPLVRGRKGHHEPVANWARDHGFNLLRVDGGWTELSTFRKLDRYREHNVDLVVAEVTLQGPRIRRVEGTGNSSESLDAVVEQALEIGKGSLYLMDGDGPPAWFSTRRSDPVTGEAYPELDPKDFSWNAPRGWCPACRGHGWLHPWMQEDERYPDFEDIPGEGCVCPDCGGERLNPVSRAVYLTGPAGQRRNLPALLAHTPGSVLAFLEGMDLEPRERLIRDELLPEIRQRLAFMEEVGLGYLCLDRATATLSGGEAQRIRLAAQLGSNLSGTLYVLDEPSIGLHERDNARLLDSLRQLREKGNTVLVVEHDPRTIEAADHIIDLGPGAGQHGGEVLAAGNLKRILRSRRSLTAHYLKHPLRHPLRGQWRPLPAPFSPRKAASREAWLVLRKASLRNLKGADIRLPKGRLIGICGVSGAGKSTLMRDLLMPAIQRAIHEKQDRLTANPRREGFAALLGARCFRQVIEVDQSPIGKTPRSTPATYIGAFDTIRALYATTPESRMHGYNAGTFSFNTKGGRCETCKGAGRIKLEMNFMPDTYVPCEECGGRRYSPDVEEVRWNGKSIADVLEMTFEEAAAFFSFDSRLAALLDLMVETGLGYLTLGQSSPTLSGGEAQRLKLVSELARGLPTLAEGRTGRFQANFYLLEEPTIGLHMKDCERLIHILHRLVDQGHTVAVIEHQMDVLAEADYLVEIGPEGGEAGGFILHQGGVEELAQKGGTPTSPYLPPILGEGASGGRHQKL